MGSRARPRSSPASPGGWRDAWTTLRLALRSRRDPAQFAIHTGRGVVRYLRSRGIELRSTRILDAGAGGGALSAALREAGARPLGLDLADYRLDGLPPTPLVLGDVGALPLRDGAVGGVVSSNVLEHVPDPFAMLRELARVVVPGGFVYLSWTNWLSPLGGHEMSPLHYLGPERGLRAYRTLWGRDPRWNVPGRNLFVTRVSDVLAWLESRSELEVLDVTPRYWPGLRFIVRLGPPREVLMWNCVVLMRRT